MSTTPVPHSRRASSANCASASSELLRADDRRCSEAISARIHSASTSCSAGGSFEASVNALFKSSVTTLLLFYGRLTQFENGSRESRPPSYDLPTGHVPIITRHWRDTRGGGIWPRLRQGLGDDTGRSDRVRIGGGDGRSRETRRTSVNLSALVVFCCRFLSYAWVDQARILAIRSAIVVLWSPR
jgi:hypothetical protein